MTGAQPIRDLDLSSTASRNPIVPINNEFRYRFAPICVCVCVGGGGGGGIGRRQGTVAI